MKTPTTIPSFPELEFEERKHIYLLNGMEIPSMTTIMHPLSEKVYGPIDPEILSNAARKGTIVHNAIENYLEFGIMDIPEDLLGYFEAFRAWRKAAEPEILSVESKVYHKILRYAGTCDLLCKVKGVMTLVDYKTSYQLQPMLHSVQLEGYAKAWESQGIKFEDRMILHLKKDGRYTEHHYPASAEHYSVVSALMTLYNYQLKY